MPISRNYFLEVHEEIYEIGVAIQVQSLPQAISPQLDGAYGDVHERRDFFRGEVHAQQAANTQVAGGNVGVLLAQPIHKVMVSAVEIGLELHPIRLVVQGGFHQRAQAVVEFIRVAVAQGFLLLVQFFHDGLHRLVSFYQGRGL